MTAVVCGHIHYLKETHKKATRRWLIIMSVHGQLNFKNYAPFIGSIIL